MSTKFYNNKTDNSTIKRFISTHFSLSFPILVSGACNLHNMYMLLAQFVHIHFTKSASSLHTTHIT